MGNHGRLYVDCGLDSVHCNALVLVDTDSRDSLIRCGILPAADAACFAEADCIMLRITTVTREQAVMSGKRTVHVTMGNSTYAHDFILGLFRTLASLGLLGKWGATVDVATIATLCGPDRPPLPFLFPARVLNAA